MEYRPGFHPKRGATREHVNVAYILHEMHAPYAVWAWVWVSSVTYEHA